MSIPTNKKHNVKEFRFGQATPMTQADYETIYEHLHTDVHRCFLAVAWYTGQKPGAILDSKVEQFYTDPSTRVVRRKIICKDKEVFCHRNLKKILGNYNCLQDGYLFPSRVCPGRHLSRQAFDKVFRKALKEAKLDGKGYSLHSLHTGFMSRLGILGCSPRLIQILASLNSETSKRFQNAIANF